MSKETANELFSFIQNSPTAFHAVETMRSMLDAEGYEQLLEGQEWKLAPGKRYYVIRNHSALIAFRIPAETITPTGFQIMASHDDSPLFKIKENPELETEGHYVKLNVEKYGGMLCAPWLDRPLSCAGRVIAATEKGIEIRLVDAKRPIFVIPNLAIHMNREANDGMKYNAQKDMLPLYGDETAKGSFSAMIADLAGVPETAVIGRDLYVYSCMEGTVWGAHDEYMSIGRLDDLECVFASLKGFLQADTANVSAIPVHCVFDNEEVGSGTRQGAASTFLADTLKRLCDSIGISESGFRQLIAHSFLISADNAHAVHPNYPEKSDPSNRPYMNGGIVMKYSANQKYTTDGLAAGLFRAICKKAGVSIQTFQNRSDVIGGSTLGNISIAQVPVNSIDIGLAQLAMHSPYETAGTKDLDDLITAAACFYSTGIIESEYGVYTLK